MMQTDDTIVGRIRRMELYFDTMTRAMHNDAKILQDPPLKAMLDALIAYYDSGQWLADYKADECGELPADLKRGVLSQDAVYDLLSELQAGKDRAMMQTKDIVALIDQTLVDIWENEIKSDYECGWLLKEDTLKNALYFHLRSKLGTVFEYNHVRIFTEFTDGKFKGTGCRSDMVIARVDMNASSKYWGDDVIECLAVIEIKYKSCFTSSNDIIADSEKLKYYAQELGVNAKLYMATIWEYEDDPTTWEHKNAALAKGRLTELNASYRRNSNHEIQFYVCRH